MSIAFANSPQFAATFSGANATTPANTALVTAMYQNVLGRAPDAPGLAFWLSSGLNAAQLLQAFTQSAEDINLLAPHIIAFQNLEASGDPALVPVPPTSLLNVSPAPETFTLTTGVDHVVIPGNNNTVNGIGGGPTGAAVGSTFTPNDSINFGTTTGNIFNLQGIGPAGTWNVTSVPGAKVSGIQTVNIASNTLFGALSSQAVTGDFTATGPEGDWTGLTLLAVSSGSGILGGVDNLTVGPATAVQVTDSLLGPTATPMTINGGSNVTITENNTLGFGNAGITVNGGTGTTSVSITQTELLRRQLTVPSISWTRTEPARQRRARSQLSRWMGSAIPYLQYTFAPRAGLDTDRNGPQYDPRQCADHTHRQQQ